MKKADLNLVLSHVLSLPEVDSSRVFLQGESQGGFISTLVAEERPAQVRGLILWFPALMIPEASRQRIALGITEVFGIRLSPDFDRIAAGMDPWTPMKDYPNPVLILQGDQDPVVLPEVSRKACSLFPRAELVILPGASHGFGGKDLETALRRSVDLVSSVS